MKLIKTSKLLFVIVDCYSSNEDISQTFTFTLQSSIWEAVDDKRISHEIEMMNLGYDFDEMIITVIERDCCTGQFIEREIEW